MVSLTAVKCYDPGMRIQDIKSIRLANLKQLLATRPMSDRLWAAEFGISPGYLSQILSGHRQMGDQTADKIEKAVGLAAGQLSSPTKEQRFGGLPLLEPTQLDPFLAKQLEGQAITQRQDKPAHASDNAFWIKAFIDTMVPDVSIGTLLCIDPEHRAENGSLVLVRQLQSGHFILARYLHVSDPELHTYNPESRFKLSPDAHHIVGRVIARYL